MEAPNKSGFSKRAKITIAGIGLMGLALLLTVTFTQQRQNQRSKAAASFVLEKAINFNGPTIYVDGVKFLSDAEAGVQYILSPERFSDPSIPLNPTTSSSFAQMMRSSVWYRVDMNIPVINGSYQVYVYNWEDSYDQPETFSFSLEGQPAGVNIYSGAAGQWRKLGPYNVTVSDGNLSLKQTAGGDFNLSGIELYRLADTTSSVATTTSTGQRLVQQNFLSQGGPSKSVSFPANVTAGNLIVVPVSWYQGTITRIYDNRGNTYNPVTSIRCAYNGTNDCVQLYYVKNAIPGQTTVTVTFSDYTDSNIGIYEYSGYDTYAPLDKVAGATGYSTTPNGGTLTTSINNELYFAVGVDNWGNGTGITPGSGYTLRHSTLDYANNERFYSEDRISPAGSYQSNFTIGGGSSWAAIGASFKPAIVVPTSLPTATPWPTATPTPRPTSTPVPQPTATPLPLPTATPRPTATPTPRPTSTPYPTYTPYPTQTPYPTAIPATATPFPTDVPTPTQFIPTNTPMPSPTPVPGNTIAKFSVFLHGIGKGGDSVNPNATGNLYPLHPQRDATIDIYDVQNQLVTSQQGKITYNLGNGNFEGSIDLGNQFTTGIYTVKVKTDHYLRGLFAGIQTITNGSTVTFPSTTLVNGDTNNDNQINIMDYNLIIGCYSDLLPAIDCDDYRKLQTDLNDDGDVNQFDYNLFIRELTNIGGQ